MTRELAEAREYQMALKVHQATEAARAEKADFDRVLRETRLAQEGEREARAAAAAVSRQLKVELLAQVSEAEERKKLERAEELEEGRRVRERLEVERARLEAIRARKLQELRDAGVPEQYTAELMRMQIKA